MKIIAFCGIDGAGKTTQVNKIKFRLTTKGYKVWLSKVSYYPFHVYENKTITQYEIRIGMAFFFAQHYLTLIPQLKQQKYDYVLCDRHALCHLAFAKTYGINDEQLNKLNAIFSIGGHPDLTFYFDIPLEVSLERIRTRKDKPVDQDEIPEILGSTLENYARLINTDSFKDTVHINATLPSDNQTQFIMNMISRI